MVTESAEQAACTPTLADALAAAAGRLGRQDARLLLEHASGCSRAELIAHPERRLTEVAAAMFASSVARRAAGEPMAYLLGSAWFDDIELAVTPDVLIPRQDTEVLIREAVLRASVHPAPTIVDLGTGSGVVAISLARRCPQATVYAVDRSAAALAVARRNAESYAVAIRFLEGDWYAPLAGMRFDFIVSNPPYVAADDPHLLCDGLPFEPREALTDGVAGGDGMGCLQEIIGGATAHLAEDGCLLVEHGYDQAVKVRELLLRHGFADVASWRDGASIERVSGGRLRRAFGG